MLQHVDPEAALEHKLKFAVLSRRTDTLSSIPYRRKRTRLNSGRFSSVAGTGVYEI